MKQTNVFLFALFFLLSAGQLWAQEQKPYKPVITFNGDTAQYLEYNYTIRSAQYKGKTAGEILRELEYPVLYVVGTYGIGLHTNIVTRLSALSLYIRQVGNEPSELKDYYITIIFENPPIHAEYKEASGLSGDNPRPVFSQKLYDFIKDLKVSSVFSNEYILKDPEILRARQEKYEKFLREFKQLEAEEIARKNATLEN